MSNRCRTIGVNLVAEELADCRVWQVPTRSHLSRTALGDQAQPRMPPGGSPRLGHPELRRDTRKRYARCALPIGVVVGNSAGMLGRKRVTIRVRRQKVCRKVSQQEHRKFAEKLGKPINKQLHSSTASSIPSVASGTGKSSRASSGTSPRASSGRRSSRGSTASFTP